MAWSAPRAPSWARKSSGVDALRVAHARISAGQSEISLVGGAYNGTRWDLVLMFTLGTPLLKGPFSPVWDRGPDGALALAAMGAFVVIESRAHAEKRGAKPVARLLSVQSSRNLRRPGETEATLRDEWSALETSVKKDCAVVISGASGAEPATSEERKALARHRASGPRHRDPYWQWDGGAVPRQYRARVARPSAPGHCFRRSGSGDVGAAPAKGICQALVTSVGNWRGEGLALVERID